MEEVNADFRIILGHSIKHGGLGIPDPQMSTEIAYNNSKGDIGELIGSLQGVNDPNYGGHRVFVLRASAGESKEHNYL